MPTAKIMVSIPKDFLEEIDRAAQEEHRSRSEFFREAARVYLQLMKRQRQPGLDPKVQRAVAIQDAIARQIKGDWDSTEEVRRWREARR